MVDPPMVFLELPRRLLAQRLDDDILAWVPVDVVRHIVDAKLDRDPARLPRVVKGQLFEGNPGMQVLALDDWEGGVGERVSSSLVNPIAGGFGGRVRDDVERLLDRVAFLAVGVDELNHEVLGLDPVDEPPVLRVVGHRCFVDKNKRGSLERLEVLFGQKFSEFIFVGILEFPFLDLNEDVFQNDRSVLVRHHEEIVELVGDVFGNEADVE